jgi:hypothetical protein
MLSARRTASEKRRFTAHPRSKPRTAKHDAEFPKQFFRRYTDKTLKSEHCGKPDHN